MSGNYFKLITNFNSDKEIIALREKYKEPTFFEIISKQRSENTYSSFLKWMFQSSSNDLNSVSPILLLLDILVKRGEEQNQQNKIVYFDDNFKKQIVTRDFQLNSIEVETEKLVGVLVDELKTIDENAENSDVDQELLIKKCQDRIDIFIKCHLDNNQELHIIIENKIDSNEGLNKKQVQTGCNVYDKSLQTSRYYVATKRKNQETLKQLYVYLTPSLNNECECANFIKITYQDIIDGIIVPMLSTTSLSSRARFFLEELKTELTFPSLEGSNVKSSIAISNENSERFNKIWERHGKLIIDAAIATSESDIWYIKNNNNNNCFYYDYPPRQELLDRLPPEIKSSLRSKPQYNTLQGKIKNVKDLDLDSDLCKIDGDVNLLKMFWENNKRFLLALMNGLPETERKKIECLSAEVSKRDNTKYYVYFEGQSINGNYLGQDKPANNSETAWIIIAHWASQQQQSPVTLDGLRDKFKPADCNKYYAKGDYLNHLFYEYKDDGKYEVDGTKNQGQIAEAGGWDFYRPKDEDEEDRKFRIRIKDDKDAIMLKVWRKSELNRLIELVTNNEDYFGGKLSVQPDR